MTNIVYFWGNRKHTDELFKKLDKILDKKKIFHGYNMKYIAAESDISGNPSAFIIEPEFCVNGISGVVFAEKARKCFSNCEFIFVSANYLSLPEILCRYIKPTAYFLYPVNDMRFFELMVKIISGNKKACEKIVITSEYKKLTLYLEEILYFTTENKKIICVLLNGERINFYDTMASLEKRISQSFVRCHSGFLINKRKIQEINKNPAYIRLSDCEEKIPVSRKYKENFSEMF